jgi:hypothetical protein
VRPCIAAGEGTVTAEVGEFGGAEFDALGGGDVDHWSRVVNFANCSRSRGILQPPVGISIPTKPGTRQHQRRMGERRSRCGIGQGTNARQRSARRYAMRGCHRTHRQRPSRGRSRKSRSSVSGGELR